MKTLLFCNLVPLKTGAYETLLAAVGEEFRKHGDEYVVVFAGEPIPPVAESLSAAGVRWRIIPEWTEMGRKAETSVKSKEKRFEQKETKERKGVGFSAAGGSNNYSSFPSFPSVQTSSSPERVSPWAFVFPALRIIREERPDVVAVHFGNELPTLAASLSCRVMVGWTRVVDLVRGKKDLLTRSREASEEDIGNSASGGGNKSPFASSRLRVRNSLRAPRWIWEQDQQIQDPGPIARHLSKLRLLGVGVDRFLAVYEGGRQSMLKRGIPAGKITVIHNSVAPYTPTREKGWLRKEFNIGADEAILVTNGSLIPRKRIDFILHACAALQQVGRQITGHRPQTIDLNAGSARLKSNVSGLSSLPPWRLLIIGEGPELASLGELARELGIADRVYFLGLRNDVREILPECDIYLHASKAETCTYAVSEAMAAGMPVVMLNAGAAREQIEQGVTGYVYDVVTQVAFSTCLSDLMDDSVRRIEMGRLAKSRWGELFRVEQAAARYHEMYAIMAGAATSSARGGYQ